MENRRILERGIYPLIAFVMWITALVGFWPGYVGPAIDGNLAKTSAVHFHVVVYVGWLVLFTIQATLPMLRKGRLHRKIGRFGIAYGALVWFFGLHVTWSRFVDRVQIGSLDDARHQALPPFSDMLIFPILFGLAVYYRDRPEIHKRLMVLAGTMLMIAAVARMALNGLIPPNPLIFDLVWLAPVWLAIAHDVWRTGRPHVVYAVGAPLLAIVPLRMALLDWGPWRALTDRVAQWILSS